MINPIRYIIDKFTKPQQPLPPILEGEVYHYRHCPFPEDGWSVRVIKVNEGYVKYSSVKFPNGGTSVWSREKFLYLYGKADPA